MLTLVGIFVLILCTIGVVLFATKINGINDTVSIEAENILQNQKTKNESEKNRNAILQNLKDLKEMVNGKIEKYDFLSDQDVILDAINNISNRIKILLHDTITSVGLIKNQMDQLSQPIEETLTIVQSQPKVEELKQAISALEFVRNDLSRYFNKDQVSLKDVFDRLGNIYREISNNAVTEIVQHIPEEKIKEYENKLTTLVETSELMKSIVQADSKFLVTVHKFVQDAVNNIHQELNDKINQIGHNVDIIAAHLGITELGPRNTVVGGEVL